jgi:hypothetical protein
MDKWKELAVGKAAVGRDNRERSHSGRGMGGREKEGGKGEKVSESASGLRGMRQRADYQLVCDVLEKRRGEVLGKGTILKTDFYEFASASLRGQVVCLAGTPFFRGVPRGNEL